MQVKYPVTFLNALLYFTLFYRSFDRDWIDECEDIEINKSTSGRWRFSNNSISGRMVEIPFLDWNNYGKDYYLINIKIEPNVFQTVHGFHISDSTSWYKSLLKLGEFERMPQGETWLNL